MEIHFGRRRRNNSKFDFLSLERVLSGLQLKDQQLSFDEEDTWGPLGLVTIHCPSEPLLEFIFIHGLGGGSRKTWSFSSKLHHFWPKEWLSKDPAFQNVRVHSFGYKSTWHDTRGSILNVHDIAESLLGAIHASPSIRSSLESKIVLIAHSLGGLVAKKAYIEARVNTNYQQIGRRIHSLYFLATPHQGSESSQLAQTLISLSPFHGEKPFVQDLKPTSAMIQLINSEFPRYSQDVQLFSFYETLETWAGSSRMIVNQQSATLGYVNEQRMPLNKNHRGVCKFEKPTDRDFITLRNALSQTVDSILKEDQLHALRDYLGVREKPEDDLIEFEDLCMPESCSWFTSKPMFREWRDCVLGKRTPSFPPKEPDLFKAIWLHGMPGTGKSVLTSQVINHLESFNLDCSYYYFSSEDRAKSTISGLLRSLAYQMALLSSNVREKILTMNDNGVHFDKDNEKLIWRKLFISGIFRCDFAQPQYWVIDALDECKDYASLLPMLAKIESGFPLRVLLTSRPSLQLQGKLSLLGSRIQEEQMSFDNTHKSIRLFVEKGLGIALGHQNDGGQRELVERIVEKSEGCFLWANLVMEELENHAYNAEEVEHILEEMPPGMHRLYERTLKSLTESENDSDEKKRVSKTILSLIACAVRPLTVLELTDALKIQFNMMIFEQTIRSSCGNLIYIDKATRVCLVHKTARDFLLSPDLESEFRVQSADANRQLGLACLKFLRSSQMRPVRTQGLSGHSILRIERRISNSPFAEYACTYFSDHIRRSHSDDDDFVDQIYAFLTTNALTWIEHIAYRGKLDALVRASQNLRGYLQARAKYRPLLDRKSQLIQSWSIDLIRLVAKFGKNLLRCPSSIFGLIPPLAPPESAIASQYKDTKGIQILGLSQRVWDDRLCSISFHGKTATAVAYGDSSFAVGLQNGAVYIYDHTTFQELQVLQHQEVVKILRYNLTGDLLVCGGLRRIRLFNVADGSQLWFQSTPGEPLALAFTDQDQCLMTITRSNNLVIRDCADGEAVRTKLRKNSLAGGVSLFQGGDITCASFSLASNMLATVHRGQPVTLTDLDNDEYIGCCEKDASSDPDTSAGDQPVEAILAIKFNPNPDIGLLAVTYIDGTLALFDPNQQTLVAAVEDSEAAILASSPDGRTLGVGSSSGIIMLYEFETLKLLYRIIHTSDINLRTLAFSSDSQRIVDIRESQCNVWAPPLLMLSDSQDTDSVSDAIALPMEDFASPSDEGRMEITALVCLTDGDAIFCGMDDGFVALYSTATGKKLKNMYRHAAKYWITDIIWNSKSNFIASVDGVNGVLVKELRHRKEWEIVSEVFTTQLTSPIKQLLFNISGTHLLVVTTQRVFVFQLQGEKTMRSIQAASAGRWVNDPTNPDQVIAMEPDLLKFYGWNTLHEVSGVGGVRLNCNAKGQLTVQEVTTSPDGKIFILKLSKFDKNHSTTHFCLLESSICRADAEEISVLDRFDRGTAQIEHLIGVNSSTLFFLNKDLWVCSLKFSGDGNECTSHMFIPDEWINRSHRLIFQLAAKGDMIFVNKAKIAVIKRGTGHKAILNNPPPYNSIGPRDEYLQSRDMPSLKTPACSLPAPSYSSPGEFTDQPAYA
ncbi:hypothetical protein BDZ45DRAFT_231863 [Acephala macrosclerotiorum]|nr:hypothetical protein BDZ45DRAFT_231863 [Acephala macrosclerotiorum]